MTALPKNTTALQIFCPELTPGLTQGVFKPGRKDSTITHTNIAGVAETATVSTTNHIVAEWRTLSNFDYPPDVGLGEQVILYQQANSDKFYWDAVGRDNMKRTTELRRSSISATPNPNEEKTDNNTYSEEWNSKEGYVDLLRTSKVNGEACGLFFGFNTKEGRMMISDDTGNEKAGTPANFLVIDFANQVLQFTNNSKSVFRIDKKSCYVTVEEDFIVSAKRKVVMDTPLFILNKAKAGAVIINAASVAVNASSDVVMTAARVGINAATKIAGVLVAGATRLLSYTTGAVGAAYSPVTADYTDTAPSYADNASDTDTAGSGMRTVAAFEDVDAAFQATAEAIKQVAEAVPTGVDVSGILTNSTKSEIKDSKGT